VELELKWDADDGLQWVIAHRKITFT
jgi:hypothetical protein